MNFDFHCRPFVRLSFFCLLLSTFAAGCKRQEEREITPDDVSLEEASLASDRQLLAVDPADAPGLQTALPPDVAAEVPEPSSSPAVSDPTMGYEAWFQRYGLDLSDPKMLDADADGDGYSNRDEFLVDTDPTDATSRPGFHPVMRLSTFEEVDLPLVVKSVSGRRATVLNEDSGDTISVETGDELPGTSYRVEEVREKVESDKFGEVADMSRITAKDSTTGELLNLTVGMRPRSQATSARLVSTADPSVAVQIRQGEEFDWPGENGGRHVVVDLRPEQAVVKRLETGEVFTIPLERPKQ